MALTQFKVDKNSIYSSFRYQNIFAHDYKKENYTSSFFFRVCNNYLRISLNSFPKTEIILKWNYIGSHESRFTFHKKANETFCLKLVSPSTLVVQHPILTYFPFKCALLPSAMSLTHMIMCKNAIAACNDKNVWVRSVVYIFPLRSVAWWQQKTGFLPTTTQPIIPSDCLNCSQ